jgi:hypothetical protein
MEFDSDHRPVVATIAAKLHRTDLKKAIASPRYNVRKLDDPMLQQQYAVTVSNRFAALANEESADWSIFKDAINETASTCIGTVKRSCKEWISDKTWSLIEKKREARLAGRLDDYKSTCKECKGQLKKDRQRWADEIAETGKRALANGQIKDAFANLRHLRRQLQACLVTF